MKGKIFSIALVSLLSITSHVEAQIPIVSLVTGAIKKVIQAIDLKVQQAQTKVIWLQNAQRTVENAMSQADLKGISGWTDKYKQLYSDYFQELWKVKKVISDFMAVKDIVQRQMELVNEYDHAWGLLRQDTHFTPAELRDMYTVYNGILNESMENIDQVKMVVNSFATQMSDGKRMELVMDAANRIEINLATLRSFNDHNARLSLSRATSTQDAEQLKQVYGL
ncbi:conjugal transfer protein TraI [Dinghuibacter silviterrae]|uniref:Conjugal transfer protein TraI n=1 Tax=Dinghuibacter silviterrae TaxID=1539049 RepID=A0A4R8DSW7_9BACT|nr:conjugal transfer protein TraI [Dinghuibacter silviterrae]TDX00505.1 hypothetical protein EDB95_1530 [Dinghuibacter silviterrae]